MSYNLALIVHRLLAHPRGWPVEDLKRELAIADRTYRKYRQLLTDEFQPFQGRDGSSLVKEVEVGPVRYLRLVGLREAGISDPDFEARLASAYLARQWFHNLDGTRVGRAVDDLFDEFRSCLRDRAFVESSMITALDERIVVKPLTFSDGVRDHIDVLVSAVLRKTPVQIELKDGTVMVGCVEEVRLERTRFEVLLETGRRADLKEIGHVKSVR